MQVHRVLGHLRFLRMPKLHGRHAGNGTLAVWLCVEAPRRFFWCMNNVNLHPVDMGLFSNSWFLWLTFGQMIGFVAAFAGWTTARNYTVTDSGTTKSE